MSSNLEEVSLLEVCDFYSGKAHENHVTSNGKYKIINSKFVATEGEVYKESNQSFLTAKKHDITMVMSDLPNGRALAKCFLVDQDEKYAVNQRVCILRSKGYDPKYLYYVLNRNPYFLAFNDGVSQTHLLNHVFEKCKLSITKNVVEQKAIAEALSDIDDLIRNLTTLLKKKTSLFEGTRHELLSGKRRLTSYVNDWKLTKVADLVTVDWGNTNLTKASYKNGGQYLAVSATGIDGHIDHFEHEAYVPVISAIGALCGKMMLPKSKFVAIKNTITLTPFKNKVDGAFIFHFFNYCQLPIRGGAQPFISKGDVENFEIFLPIESSDSFQEQKEIGSILEDMSSEIDEIQVSIQKYELLKQGMMNDLLTGKIRLV